MEGRAYPLIRFAAGNPLERSHMKKITFSDRLRYAFDNTMARGTPALIVWLGIVTAVVFVYRIHQ